MTAKRFARLGCLFLIGALIAAPNQSSAWGGLGHRTVAAVAAQLLPKEKVDRMNQLLSQLELDNNFIDAASYPDEYVRDHDPHNQFRMWHFADLPDDPSRFKCNDNCLYFALRKILMR